MARYCTTCGRESASDMAKRCTKCGAVLPLTTALTQSISIEEEPPSLGFLATDLARIEHEWKKNRELLRHRDFFWNILGRDISEYQVHQTIKRMQTELELMDEQTYKKLHALKRQHTVEQARSHASLSLTNEEVGLALGIAERRVFDVQRIVNGLMVSDETREHLATFLIEEVVLKPLQNALKRGREGAEFDVMEELRKLLGERVAQQTSTEEYEP